MYKYHFMKICDKAYLLYEVTTWIWYLFDLLTNQNRYSVDCIGITIIVLINIIEYLFI